MKEEEIILSLDDSSFTNLKTYLLEMLQKLRAPVISSFDDKEAAEKKFDAIKILLSLYEKPNAFANIKQNTIRFTIGMIKDMTQGELMHVMGHELYHLFYHAHGLKVEENNADRHSTKWLMAAGIAPQAGIDCIRKLAASSTPREQSEYGWVKDLGSSHSPYEFRIQYMLTELATLNQFGETQDLVELNENISPAIEQELKEAMKKKPGPQKIHQMTLEEAKQEIEKATDNFDTRDFVRRFRAIVVKQSDSAAILHLEELVNIAYRKFSKNLGVFSELYANINAIIVTDDNYSIGRTELIPMGIFKTHQQLITAFSETDDVDEKAKYAREINKLVHTLQDLHQAIFRAHSRIMVHTPLLWHNDEKLKLVILNDNTHQIALAYWNLGIYDKDAVIQSMLQHHPNQLRDSINESLYQYFAFSNNTISIGRLSSEDRIEYQKIKEIILKPRLIQEEISRIEKHKTDFVEAIKKTNFAHRGEFKAFCKQYPDALHIYKNVDDKYVPEKIQNSNNSAIDCIADTFHEMLNVGNAADIENIKGFYDNIHILLTSGDDYFYDNNLLIPSDSRYAQFLASHASILGVKWTYEILFGDYSKFSLKNSNALFCKMSGVSTVKSIADFRKIIEFYDENNIKNIPDGILKSLLQDLSNSLESEKIEINDKLWLLKFLNERISAKQFQCSDVKHEILKDKITWTIDKDELDINDLVPIYLMYDKTFSFPDFETRDFFGDVIIERLEKLDLNNRIAWLDILIIQNSLSNFRLKKILITKLVLSIKEMISIHKQNRAEIVDKFTTYLIDKVHRRDLILILDQLTSALQSQIDECQNISQKLKQKKIEDTPKSHAMLSGAETLLRFVTNDEPTRLEFIKFLLDPITSHSAHHIASVFLQSPNKDEIRRFMEATTYLGGRDIWSEFRRGELGSASFISEQYQLTLLKSLLYDFHIQYHDFPIEIKAVLMNFFIIPGNQLLTEENHRQAFHQAINFVIERLFPASHFSEEERSFLQFYINTAPAHTRELLLAGMLAASHANNQLQGPARIGQLIAFFCENRGPAEVKIAQGLQSHPKTPKQMKDDLKNVKAWIKMPTRWEFSDLIMALDPTIRENISHMGHRLGAASYNIAIEVIYKGRKAVLLLPRENSVKMAQHSFDHLKEALIQWSKNSSTSRQEISQTLQEIIRQTSSALTHETNYTTSVNQEGIATHLYDDTTVTIGNTEVQFHTMKTISFNQQFRILEQAEGTHFNDLPEGSETRKTSALAIAFVEICNLLRGKRIDSDRHGAQMKVKQEANIIKIGLFDFGEVMVDLPSEHDISQLAEAIPYMMGELIKSSRPDVPTFQHYIQKVGSVNLSPYVARCYRSLLALQDYLQDIELSDLFKISKQALMLPDLNLQLRESFHTALTQLKHYYLGQSIFSPLLELASAQWFKNQNSTIQLTRTLVPDPLPERFFSTHAKSHSHFFRQAQLKRITLAMDALPEPYFPTGEPTWKIRVEITYENNTIVNGTAKFYGTPMLCRSPDASQLNLFQATGPFQDFLQQFNFSEVQDICKSLPPSNSEILFSSMRSGAFLGTFRGAGNVTEKALESKTSKTLAFCAGKTLTYSCYFAYELSSQMIQHPEFIYDWTTPVVEATISTARLAAIDVGFAAASKIFSWVSTKTSENLPTVSSFTGFFGRHLSKCALPYQVYQQGLSNVMGSMGASMLSEEVITHLATPKL